MARQRLSNRAHLWLNFALFQVAWLVCVLAAARQQPWIGLLAVGVVLAVHAALAQRASREWLLAGCVAVIGTALDSAILMTGWIHYTSGVYAAGVAPLWITALWALFATALNVSMRWLRGRILLAVLFGAIGGPVSYWAAARLGAVQFVDALPLVIALSVVWAVAMPLCMLLSKKFDGIAPVEERFA